MSDRTFLGYAVFYNGEPFPCSQNTVTRDRAYLITHALFKLNAITIEDLMAHNATSQKHVWPERRKHSQEKVSRLWRNHRSLSLRRVYAIGRARP